MNLLDFQAERSYSLTSFFSIKESHLKDFIFSGRNSPPQQRTQRNRRFSGMVTPTYFIPRYVMAPDRFLGRSHLVEVTRRPENLLIKSVWDDLSEDIWEKFISNQQTEVTYKNKMMLWKYLFIFIKVS